MTPWTKEQSLSQQAFSLAQTIREKKDGLYYWLVDDEHTAAVAKDCLKIFSEADVFAFDISRDDMTFALMNLESRRRGVYIMTSQFYEKLPIMLGLIEEKKYDLAVGDDLSPAQLKKKLLDLGYENEANSVFGFVGKGGSFQINQGENSARILLGEEDIEEITVDGNKVQTLSLPPIQLDLSEIPEKTKQVPRGEKVSEDLSAFQFGPTDKYNRNFKKLAQDLEKFKDFKIIISAVDTEVIKTALTKENVDFSNIEIKQQESAAQGFIEGVNRVLYLSHADIFGRAKVKERKRRDDAAFVTKLKAKDYVVHEDHGIARFLGLKKTEIEGHERENLVLEYAKGDKLYVPVEMAYKVDRYIGEAKPKLQRLSGTSWIRLSRKASQDSQQFARDLLKVYARRSLVKVDPWLYYPEADKKLHKSFGYHETPDQEQAIQDVYKALTKDVPMDYLVVGDVGFGKTEVAIRAAYQAVLNGKQVAVLCPTTLLAQQHYDTFTHRLKSLGVKVEMLSRFTGKVGNKSVSVKEIVKQIKEGEVDIAIGTHRLLSKDIDFRDIGLVIIDEEQKFGVRHKEKLKKLRTQAHILTLSATPIPRTLYFSLSGLRDISTITTPPKGRQPIETVIHEYDESLIKKAIKAELKRGGQVFYLYNKVQTIINAKKRLLEILGSKVRIDIVHGQMPETEMARVAAQFDAGKIDVLVCTTIIENGLDMPNVNTLIVHNATRYGIGQLYQIRGRIGRGSVKAHAYFLHPAEGISGVAETRLKILEEAKELGSGFQLAMRDLEMRGMGQLLGKRQHGHIVKVGLGMYGRLLRQAVEEMETGEIQQLKPAVNINLPLDYGIPEALISDSEERVRLYRQLSQSAGKEEVKALLGSYQAKIDQLNKAEQERLNNLVNILELRFTAEKAPLKSIDYQEVEGLDGSIKHQIELEFEELKSDHVEALIPIVPDFKVVDNKIVFSAEEIGDYFKDLKAIISAII